MMSKRIFLVLILVLTLYCNAYLYLTLADPGAPLYDNIDALRARTLDLSSGPGEGAAGPAIASFLPLSGQDGCVLDRSQWLPGPMGDSGEVNLTLIAPTVVVSGYSVTTVCEPLQNGRSGHAMVAVVEGRSPDTGTWHPLPNLDSVCNVRLEALRGNGTVCWRATGSVEADWVWYINLLGSSLVTALGFAVTLVLALLGRQRLARWALLSTFWLYAGCLMVASAGSLAHSSALQTQLAPSLCFVQGISDLTYGVPFSVLAIGMTVVKRNPVAVLASFLATHVSGSSVRHFFLPALEDITEDPVWVALDFILGPQFIVFVVTVCLIASRKRVLWMAHRLVRDDAARYKAAWTELLSQQGVGSTLDILKSQLAGFKPRRGLVVHQLRRQGSLGASVVTSASLEAVVSSSASAVSRLPPADAKKLPRMLPMRSLDQLFLQAKCLLPLVQRKVRRLAEASGGGGCARPAFDAEDGGIPMGNSGLVFLRAGGRVSDRIMWGGVKSVNRAIEKVMRAYKQVPE